MTASSSALHGLRVLDLTQLLAGPYCTKLLAEQGAEVIKVERPGSGDRSRQLGPFPGDVPDPDRSGQFMYLNANKLGITLDLKTSSGAEALRRLAVDADVVVDSFRPGTMERLGLGHRALARLNPRVVTCSITNFGEHGPYRDFVATELVLQCLGGLVYSCGEPSREPLSMPFPIAQYVSGAHAAIGILAAEAAAAATGIGDHVDVSIMESALAPQEPLLTQYFYSGEVPKRFGRRRKTMYPTAILPCRDGYVAVNGHTQSEWQRLTELIGHPEMVEDARFRTDLDRGTNAAAIDAVLGPWLMARSAREIVTAAQQARISFAMVATAADLLGSPHLAARGFFRTLSDSSGATWTIPGPPFALTGSPAVSPRRAPRLGEHNDEILCGRLGLSREEVRMLEAGADVPTTRVFAGGPPRARGPEVRTASSRLPLDGIRVLDLTQIWAGPKCTLFLAALGAEVIKVESPSRLELARGIGEATNPSSYPGRDPGPRPYNRNSRFNTFNRGKLAITLDLRSDAGLAMFKRLAAVSDVVTENFSATVMARLGLSPVELRTVKADLVTLSMPGFGSSGPERDYISWAPTIEAASGLGSPIGYDGGEPLPSNQAFPDPFAGVFGALAVLTALRHRRLTGRGQHIEISQQEALIGFGAEALLDHQMNGRIQRPRGNASPVSAPQGAYRCAGEDSWVGISVRNDRDWHALVHAMGRPAWADDAHYADVAGRLNRSVEIDRHVSEWTAGHSAVDVMELLQRHGVPCGQVLSTGDLATNAHLIARQIFEVIDHADAGSHAYFRPLSFRFESAPRRPATAAPLFGEHNERVLSHVLGLSESEIVDLSHQSVIADAPMTGVAIRRESTSSFAARSGG